MHQLPQKSTMRRSSLYLTAILRVPAFCSSQLEQQIDQSILPKGRKAQPGPTSYSHSLLLLPFPSRLRFAHPTAQRDPDAAVLKRISLKYIISQLPNAQSQPESHHYAHACDNNFLHRPHTGEGCGAVSFPSFPRARGSRLHLHSRLQQLSAELILLPRRKDVRRMPLGMQRHGDGAKMRNKPRREGLNNTMSDRKR